MSLKYALLGFLTYQSRSGYDLKQLMDVSTSNFWHAKQSQIYTTLKKMEKDGNMPLFLSAETVILSDLPSNISRMYTAISRETRLNHKLQYSSVAYIRKGAEDTMLGYPERFIFSDRELRRIEIWFKGFVAESKVNIAIKNV